MTQYGVESHTDLLRRTEKRLQSLERKPAGSTFWRGDYDASLCYNRGDVVLDASGDLMIARRYTCEAPYTNDVKSGDWDVMSSSHEPYEPPQIVTDTMPSPTAASADWTIIGHSSWTSGPLAWFRVEVQRAGADWSMNSVGQITDTTIFTIDADWKPLTDIGALWQTGYMGGESTLYADTGEFKVRSGTAGATVSSGHTIEVNVGPYVLANEVTTVNLGGASSLDQGILPLPSESVYHDTAKTVVGTSSRVSLDTPLTLDFTNPFSFPLRVKAAYQPHFYAYASGTTYLRIVMDGAEPTAPDYGNLSRRQYNGQSGTYFDEMYVEAVYTVPSKATVTFEVVGANTSDDPQVNYGTLWAQALGFAGDGSVGRGAVWARARRASSQTITRATGDQHIDFTEFTVDGDSGIAADADGIVVPADGVYVAVVAVNAPWNQTGGGTNGIFTLTPDGFYQSWQNTNNPNGNHRGTFQTPAAAAALTAGHRVSVSINPMPADGTQITIESADLYVFRVGDAQPSRKSYATTVTTSGATGLATVTFPDGLFTDPPVVLCSPISGAAPGGGIIRVAWVDTGTVTKDSAGIVCVDANGNAIGIDISVYATEPG